MRNLNFTALFFIWLAIFLPHLFQLGYSPISLEVMFFIVSGISLAIASVFFLPNRFIITLMGICIYTLLDSYFLSNSYLSIAFLFILPLCYFYHQMIKTFLPLSVILFSLVFVTTSIIIFEDESEQIFSDLQYDPPSKNLDFSYLHLIIDEQASPLARPDHLRDEDYESFLYSTYTDRGFRTFGQAISSDPNTSNSIGEMFSLSEDINNFSKSNDVEFIFQINRNNVAKILSDSGFSVRQISSNFLNLCEIGYPQQCNYYNRVPSVSRFKGLIENPVERLRVVLLRLHQDYVFRSHQIYPYAKLLYLFNQNILVREEPIFFNFTSPANSLELLLRIGENATQIKPGEALVAHLLIPHYPYIFDKDCQLKQVRDWIHPAAAYKTDDMQRVYQGFSDQSICLHTRLRDLIDSLSDRDDLVFVIHGDHGIRFTHLSGEDVDRESVSTILAIKTPDTTGELITEPVKLQKTFESFFKELFQDKEAN